MSYPTGTLTLMPIEPLPESVRDRLAQFLREWASRIREEGWDDYEQVLSTGEVLGVRAVLDPAAVDAAVEQWAATLWGIAGAEADAAGDYPRTRSWFTEVAREDAVHVPDDAGEHAEALRRILLRIPLNWGQWISVDKGWYPIIVELDQQLAEVDPAYELNQVKEKFAGLRFYFHSEVPDPDGRMRALVRKAEARCATTCELCGEPGTRHVNRHGGLKTLCESCAADRGYETIGQLVNDLTEDMAGIWSVACYGDDAASIWDMNHAEVTVDGSAHRDVTVLALPSVLRTWRIRLSDGTELESGLVGRIERIR